MLYYLFDNNFKNIFSRFQWGTKFSGIIEFYWFKFLNRINSPLKILMKGYIQLFNKYQIEEQDRILYRDLQPYLKKATQKFVDIGLMTIEQKKQWDKLPLRSNGIDERFGLISLGELV